MRLVEIIKVTARRVKEIALWLECLAVVARRVHRPVPHRVLRVLLLPRLPRLHLRLQAHQVHQVAQVAQVHQVHQVHQAVQAVQAVLHLQRRA